MLKSILWTVDFPVTYVNVPRAVAKEPITFDPFAKEHAAVFDNA